MPDEPKPKILVVEDDESITLGLQMNLEAEGYRVTVAMDGEEGLTQALGGEFDLLVLDVMLPRMNGFELVRSLRAKDENVPVIMLSARGEEMDKVMGLELGAEDYITKPFGIAEVLARIKVVLRRRPQRVTQAPTVTTYKFGDVEVDPRTREVRRDGSLVELTATEFDVLWALIEANDRALTREEMLERVWGPGHHVTLRTIDNFVLQLRSKLEADSAEPRHLVTVRGVGYRFKP